MSFSNALALIRAFFTFSQSKGDSDLQTTDAATAAPVADLVAAGTPGAVTADAAGTADAPAALANTATAPLFISGDRVALPGTLVAGSAPGAVDAGAAAPVDPDDEAEIGDELESLKALAGGGVDLFVTVLKDLVSFAIDLGHDFDTAYDKSVDRAKALAAKL